MTRLIDLLSTRIYTDDRLNLPFPIRDSRNSVRTGDCEVLVADNVTAYMFSIADKSFVSFGIDDFPNVAPIFDSIFIEWRAPLKISKGNGVYEHHPEYKDCFSGVHLMSEESDDGWKCVAVFYTSTKGRAFLTGWTNYDVGKTGRILSVGELQLLNIAVASWGDLSSLTEAQKSLLLASQNLYPAFVALAFAHCKNVELKTIIPPERLSDKCKKKTGKPLVKYKVLEIEPMKKVLRIEGQSETLGLKHALHICRGHFKDYSKGEGLFGKYKGLYWWESYVRGDPAQGVVVKDYNVNPPAQGS